MSDGSAENELLDAYKYFFHNSKEAFVMINPSREIVEFNESFLNLLELTGEEIRGLNISNFVIGDEILLLEKELAWDGYRKEFPLILKSKNRKVNCSVTAHVWISEKDDILGFHFVIKDETQMKKEYDRLFRLACYDELTGLYNRRYFFEIGETEFVRARRYNRSCVAMMLDIDNFKSINDTYGHRAGDIVLHKIAQECKSFLRRGDIIGRYGGEEFAIILVETGIAEARLVAERIRRGTADNPIDTAVANITVSVSLGLAELTPECIGLIHLLEQADYALYLAKGAGRNIFRVYEAGGK